MGKGEEDDREHSSRSGEAGGLNRKILVAAGCTGWGRGYGLPCRDVIACNARHWSHVYVSFSVRCSSRPFKKPFIVASLIIGTPKLLSLVVPHVSSLAPHLTVNLACVLMRCIC